ncbi:MAG TPA: hypothetical protein VI258_11415, partial [Rhodanobacteraceae bacterium]
EPRAHERIERAGLAERVGAVGENRFGARPRTLRGAPVADRRARISDEHLHLGGEQHRRVILARVLDRLRDERVGGERLVARLAQTLLRQQQACVLREPGALDALVRARLALGHGDASRDDEQRLAAMGYAQPDYVAAIRAANIDYTGNSEFLARIAVALGRTTNTKSPAQGESIARDEPHRF